MSKFDRIRTAAQVYSSDVQSIYEFHMQYEIEQTVQYKDRLKQNEQAKQNNLRDAFNKCLQNIHDTLEEVSE